MNNILNSLIDLGLTDKEANLYIALLKNGKSTVLELSQITKLKRPTVYLILDSLREKSLILKIPYAKKSVFLAKEPDDFFRNVMDKTKKAHDSLYQIKSLQKKEDRISVRYYEGEKGVEEALFYRMEELKNTEIVGFFAKAENISPSLIKASHRWRETLKNNKIGLRGIAPEDETLKEFRRTDSALGQLFKSIPHESYSSNCSIDASNYFVRIVLYNVNQAILIENEEIVKTIKQIFEMKWKDIK